MKRQAGRIDGDASLGAARLVEPVDQRCFGIGLAKVDDEPELLSLRNAERLDVGERVAPVDFRLPDAEQVQVRPIEDQDRLRHQRSPQAGWSPRPQSLSTYRTSVFFRINCYF